MNAHVKLPQHIKVHDDLVQGSDEWLAARRGLLTASEMKLILTPTLKLANNDKTRAHVYEIAAQRISEYVEPTFIGDEMLRGQEDEIWARQEYAKHYAPVQEVGFITNDSLGFTIGCSPDGLVGDDGMIEIKSRRQRFQIETIAKGEVPDDFVLQIQTALLVTDRRWLDFISYSGGLPMAVIRVYPDPDIIGAIVAAVTAFEAKVSEVMMDYRMALASKARLTPTERRVYEDMVI